MATGMVSTPFPMPPSLDSATDAQALTSCAAQEPQVACEAAVVAGVIGSAGQSGAGSDRQGILEEVRRTVLEDVDVKLAEKMKDLWSRGNKMLKQIDQENAQHTAKFMEELAQRREKQEALKAEQEHLRTLLTSMVQQFSMLGAVYSGSSSPAPTVPGAPGLGAESSSASGAASASAASVLEGSSPQLGTSGYAGGAFPPLPTMPDFPFPPTAAVGTPSPSIATPLSLVEALCPDTIPTPVPVSLMGSLSPSADLSAGMVFSFTLRKAEGTDLGINVSHHEHDKVLWVEGIRPEGAVEAWNRQCISNGSGEKAVVPGDRIISVNGVIGHPVKMLEECRDKLLLKFTIERGGNPQSPVARQTTPKATTLRADADVFVPAGLAPEQPPPEAPGLSLEGNTASSLVES